jgi:transposase-like protein
MFDLTNPIHSDANAAREHLETLHWPNGPVCPHCGETERVKRLAGKSTRPGVVMCNPCRKPFTVTVGTIFEDSRIALNKWLLGFRLMAGSKKGISAHQLHRSLGITYKSAWFMAHRIREAMDIDDGPLGGPNTVVEADETYVGGKAKNRAFRSPAPKKAVVALVERDGRVASKHVRHGERATSAGRDEDRSRQLSDDR